MDEESIKKQRISHLKEIKRLARKFLDANIAIQQSRKNSWERDVNENNISQLKSIINKAKKDLHERNINEFVEKEVSRYRSLVSKNHFLAHPAIDYTIKKFQKEFEFFEVLRYSPNYSITYDLYWIEDGTMGEQMDIAFGNSSPDIYEKYCPEKVEEIKTKVIPYFLKGSDYEMSVKILKNITDQFQSNIYLSTNILLITVAESMVRQLCRYVYKHQNPQLSEDEVDRYIEGKQSIETLIMNKDWLDDIEMDIREAYIQSKYIEDDSLKLSVELINRHKVVEQKIREQLQLCLDLEKKFGINEWDEKTEEDSEILNTLKEYQKEVKVHYDKVKEYSTELISPESTIKTSIRVKLQFLVRRFKEDRNSIIHGNYTDFDKGWKSYIYLAAITMIWDIIKLYQEVYRKTP